MNEPIPDTATASTGSGEWTLKVSRRGDNTIAEVWNCCARLSVTTLTAEGAVTVETSATPPFVYHFTSTKDAYDATQCRDDIRDGDVLVVESEQAVGFLDAAWPIAVTAAHGELHRLTVPAREYRDGRFAASVDLAEWIATKLGFPLAGTPTRPARGQQPAPGIMTVRVCDRGAGREYAGVTIRTVTISDRCPQCGGPRGVDTIRSHRFHEDGEWLSADRWENPCGHVDAYEAVLAEAQQAAS